MTAISLDHIHNQILNNQRVIADWFEHKWQQHTPLITGSVDLRNAGFKLSPVDTNVFPAGFNNLPLNSHSLCAQALQATLYEKYPWCHKIILVPESHTRNPFYLENIMTLMEFIQKSGYEVKLGSLLDLKEPKEIVLESGRILALEPLLRIEDKLGLKNFNPCVVLLNNDLSDGLPAILQNTKQPIIPPPHMGWFARSKTQHFTIYQELAHELAILIDLDPWCISSLFTSCEHVDFLEKKGESELVQKTGEVLQQIQKKYDHYQIKHKPFVMIKSDRGTYGMAVMRIDNPEAIVALNRKERAGMSVGKGKQKVTKVIIQEGVPTVEYINQAAAEPVIYSIGETVVGGFYRVHKQKGPEDNLNTPGMHFESLDLKKFDAYRVIASLAHLAASVESERVYGK